MPTTSTGGVSLHYREAGSGAPVVFVNEAGLGGWSWGWQHGAVTGPFRSVVWDLRGTGRSDRPAGPYDLTTLASDLEAILTAVDARNAHVVGAGLGGAIALQAARKSTRIASLTLFGTGAHEGDFDLDPLFAPPSDPEAVRASLETVLTKEFQSAQPDVVNGLVEWRCDGDATRDGFDAQTAALEGYDATDWGHEVTVPTLVCHGAADALVPPESGRTLANDLPRGEFREVDGGGHLVQVERSRTVNDHLLGVLEARTDDTD